jgi:hypothetical protein
VTHFLCRHDYFSVKESLKFLKAQDILPQRLDILAARIVTYCHVSIAYWSENVTIDFPLGFRTFHGTDSVPIRGRN